MKSFFRSGPEISYVGMNSLLQRSGVFATVPPKHPGQHVESEMPQGGGRGVESRSAFSKMPITYSMQIRS